MTHKKKCCCNNCATAISAGGGFGDDGCGCTVSGGSNEFSTSAIGAVPSEPPITEQRVIWYPTALNGLQYANLTAKPWRLALDGASASSPPPFIYEPAIQAPQINTSGFHDELISNLIGYFYDVDNVYREYNWSSDPTAASPDATAANGSAVYEFVRTAGSGTITQPVIDRRSTCPQGNVACVFQPFALNGYHAIGNWSHQPMGKGVFYPGSYCRNNWADPASTVDTRPPWDFLVPKVAYIRGWVCWELVVLGEWKKKSGETDPTKYFPCLTAVMAYTSQFYLGKKPGDSTRARFLTRKSYININQASGQPTINRVFYQTNHAAPSCAGGLTSFPTIEIPNFAITEYPPGGSPTGSPAQQELRSEIFGGTLAITGQKFKSQAFKPAYLPTFFGSPTTGEGWTTNSLPITIPARANFALAGFGTPTFIAATIISDTRVYTFTRTRSKSGVCQSLTTTHVAASYTGGGSHNSTPTIDTIQPNTTCSVSGSGVMLVKTDNQPGNDPDFEINAAGIVTRLDPAAPSIPNPAWVIGYSIAPYILKPDNVTGVSFVCVACDPEA